MDTGAALGGTGLFISLVGIIYSAVNHKHIRSRCCGRDLEMSIDIDSTEQSKGSKSPVVSKHEPAPQQVNSILKTHFASPKVFPHFTVD
jgi:hypothetical protein